MSVLAPNKRSLAVIVPARNEASRIDSLLRELLEYVDANEILVVDSASDDETEKVVRLHGVGYLYVDRPGKGRALRAGLNALGADDVVFIDGDGSYSPSCIPSLLAELRVSGVSAVYGSRFMHGAVHDVSVYRRLGTIVIELMGYCLFGRQRDFLTGLYGVKVSALQGIELRSEGFEIEAELFAYVSKSDARSIEVPVKYTKNSTSKLKPIRDAARIIKTLVRLRMMRA